MSLPLSLHFALEDRRRARIKRRWYPTLILAALVPLSLSRSSIVATVAGLLILLPSWNARRRVKALALTTVGTLLVFVLVPGLLGSLAGLFADVGTDENVSSRTDSYGLVWDFVTRSPLFGRGLGTFLPDYRILDNQFLRLVVDAGVLGLMTCVALLVAGVLVPIGLRRR